jgi:hypothetical protein
VPYLFVLGVVEVTMKWFYYNSVFEPPTADHISCPNYWWRNALYINTLFPVQDMVSYICIWHDLIHIYRAVTKVFNKPSSQYTRGLFNWVTIDSALILLWLQGISMSSTYLV